jgi:hypothetical protein
VATKTDLKNSIFGLLVEGELFMEFTRATGITHDLGFKGFFFSQQQSVGNEKVMPSRSFQKDILRMLASLGLEHVNLKVQSG